MKKTLCLVAASMFLAGPGLAQDPAGDEDNAALAQKIQNPLATLVSLPLQANYNLGFGPYERTFYNLNVQPVIPYNMGDWNVITRTIIPVNSVPIGETDSVFGIGDTSFSLFFSPASSGMRPRAKMSSISRQASRTNSPAE